MAVKPIDVEALKMAALCRGAATNVTIAEEDPDELSQSLGVTRAAVALSANQQFRLELKLPRAQLIQRVKDAREVPLAWQEVLLAEIALIDPKHEVLRLDFIRHAHGVGTAFSGTVKEI